MEQKDEIGVLHRLAASAKSFDDYLAKVEETGCDKPASAGDSSSSELKPQESAEESSNATSNAVDASEPEKDARAIWASKPDYLQNGHKIEHLSHPIPSEVLAVDEMNAPRTQEAPDYTTVLEIHDHPVVGTYLTETQVVVDKNDEWKAAFFAGQQRSAQMASLEQVMDWTYEMERAIQKIKATQQGARNHIETALKGLSAKRRSEVAEHDRKFRKNEKPAPVKVAKPTTSSKPSSTAGKTKGMKAADALVTGMGYTYEEVIEKLTATNLLDELTKKYVDATYGGK